MSPDPNKPSFWIPNADVLVNAAGELVIKMELAAMSREDIEITIDGQRLTLAGHRSDPDGKGAQFLVLEINHGRFESVVEVPKEFDLSRAQTTYQNGMFRIVAPRRTFSS
jgi:HSP20 family molecular chaperone IbpA